MGWGGGAGSGWSFFADLGVLFQGEPEVSYRATGAVAQVDIEREKRQIEDDLDEYKLFPVLSVGVAYRF